MHQVSHRAGQQAGWYYAQGDPAGTVRRWNGEQWIGFPVPNPNVAYRPSTASSPSIGVTGLVGAGIFLAGLVGYGAMLISYGAAINGALGKPLLTGLPVGFADLGQHIDQFELHVVGMAASLLVMATGFAIWLERAIVCTGVAGRRRSTTRIGSRRRRSFLKSVLVYMLFGPLGLIIYLVGGRTTRSTRRSPLDLLFAVAEEARGPGQREVNPIKILVWAVFTGLPLIILSGTLIWATVVAPIDTAATRSLLGFLQLLVALSLVAVAAGIATVAQITARLR